MKNIDEIKKIVKSYIVEQCYKEEYTYGCEEKDIINMAKELSTLIQKERTAAVMEHLNTKIKVGAIEREKEIREEAVRGFEEWFCKPKCKYELQKGAVEGYFEFLSQEGK